MVSYEFYGDSHILGLSFDSGREVFLDLEHMRRFAELAPEAWANFDEPMVTLYRTPADVRNLFGAYGCLEECPVEKEVK